MKDLRVYVVLKLSLHDGGVRNGTGLRVHSLICFVSGHFLFDFGATYRIYKSIRSVVAH